MNIEKKQLYQLRTLKWWTSMEEKYTKIHSGSNTVLEELTLLLGRIDLLGLFVGTLSPFFIFLFLIIIDQSFVVFTIANIASCFLNSPVFQRLISLLTLCD